MKQSVSRGKKRQNDSRGVSRLSRGPINPLHKTFVHNDKLIRRELSKLTARRKISIKVSEVCAKAAITTPTFYLHYRNCDDVLNRYERILMREIVKIVHQHKEKSSRKRLMLDLLLNFVARHRWYFAANCKNNNLYLLSKILDEMRIILVGAEVGDKTFVVYRGAVGALITDWVVNTKADKTMITTYVDYILRVRPMRYGW